uniref:Anoctamin n=1 Tax=Macrostomum lignano TaxID=282301 RepID=A0A1I8F4Q3_9PLAT
GPYELPKDYQPEDLNARQILNAYWAKWGLWYKYQPLDHIREYYGEKIDCLYTAWLLPASIVGIIVFLYGCFTFKANVPGCNFPGKLGNAKNASLAHHWDVMDFEEDEERPRQRFAPRMSEIPSRGILSRTFLIACAFLESSPASRMVIVVIFIIAVIIYRVLIAIPLFQNPLLRSQASHGGERSAAIVNLILIMSLGKVYEKLAYKLTQWEMHRTQTEFEDQLILKVFIFQFVNFYSSIFYIAFFKGKFTGYPGRYIKFFGLRNEECDNGGCLIELAQQLAVIMIGKQIINNCQEVFLPKYSPGSTRFTKLKLSRNQERGQPGGRRFTSLIALRRPIRKNTWRLVLQFRLITIFVAPSSGRPFFALL